MCGPPPNKTWKLRGPPAKQKNFFFLDCRVRSLQETYHIAIFDGPPSWACSNWQHHPSKVLVCSPILRISFRVEYHAEALANLLAPWRKCFWYWTKKQNHRSWRRIPKNHIVYSKSSFCRLTSCLPLLTSFCIFLHLFTSVYICPSRCKQM